MKNLKKLTRENLKSINGGFTSVVERGACTIDRGLPSERQGYGCHNECGDCVTCAYYISAACL